VPSQTLDPAPGAPPAPAESGLSTAPRPVEPSAAPGRRSSALAPLRNAWRQLTSMRTALLLLFLLAVASVPGSLLPQRGTNPLEVSDYFADNPGLAPVLDRLWLFDVYASPWFAAVYLLLFVSLVGCLGPRIRLHARALRAAPPPAPRTLSRLRESGRYESALPPEDAADEARRVLRSSRWRVVRREEPSGAVTLAAEKGYLRETGNLVFHLSLVALLIGVALGAILGYRGTVVVQEGDGFANATASYDDLTPGRLFDASRMQPFALRLEDFRVDFAENGQPLEFVADVEFAENLDDELQPARLRVNEPLTAGTARVFLLGHGYSPVLTVRDSTGEVAFAGPNPCLPQDLTFTSTCVVKVPDAQGAPGARGGTQLGFRANFAPTARVLDFGDRSVLTSAHPELREPAMDVVAFRGDLGVDAGLPQNVYQLDTSNMDELGSDFLTPGDTFELPGGGSVTFEGVEEWANLQVTSDPGKALALGASVGIVTGLLFSLTVRRRRLWLRFRPGAEGGAPTLVEAGGLSRTNADGFAPEFAELLDRLRGPDAAPAASPTPPASSNPAASPNPAEQE
jgi:cytochrome c biogenesis protein